MSDKLYDVVIYNVMTKEVTSLCGSKLTLNGGTHNASRRLSTALMMINGRHDSMIVSSGKYKVGDKINEV